MKRAMVMRLVDESEINVIRGKWLVNATDRNDVEKLLQHIATLEYALDESDAKDAFGTEGWRRYLAGVLP